MPPVIISVIINRYLNISWSISASNIILCFHDLFVLSFLFSMCYDYVQIKLNALDRIIKYYKSKATQALYLFEQGKKPIDIAVELDISYSEVFEIQQEYFALKELYDLAFVCMEIGNDLTSFMGLFKLLKRNKVLSKKQILKFLNYANEDLPTLEDRCRKLGNVSVELQIRKKRLGDKVAALIVNVTQLKKSINWYEIQIKDKNQIISNLDRQLNQKVSEL